MDPHQSSVKVVIKNCVDAATQHWLARMAMQRGTKPYPEGFYKTIPSPSPHPVNPAPAVTLAPNSKESCGRGRVYDSAESERCKQPCHDAHATSVRSRCPGS